MTFVKISKQVFGKAQIMKMFQTTTEAVRDKQDLKKLSNPKVIFLFKFQISRLITQPPFHNKTTIVRHL